MIFSAKESVKGIFDNAYVHGCVRFVLFLAIVSALGAGTAAAYPKYERLRGLNEKRENLLKEIAEMQAEIKTLADNEKRLKSDRAFAEKLAHGNRRVYPGELVFVFDD